MEGELACVDMTAVKARGHSGRKTLEVIHRHRMAHQHIPLSLSHSQTPLNLSHTQTSGPLTHTHTYKNTHIYYHTPLVQWGFKKACMDQFPTNQYMRGILHMHSGCVC